MKRYQNMILSLGLISPLSAATITANSGSAPGTDGYTWNLALDSSNNDTSTFAGTVGSWSWEDASIDTLGAGNIGWRHQSDWIALTLTETTRLSLSIARADETNDAKLFPSFTIYNNLTNVASTHFYENDETLSWDTNLTHVLHIANSSLGTVSQTLDLPAGDYTLTLGGNATSEATAVNVNYQTILTASPVPEPSTALLSLLATLSAMMRRRR